MFNSSDSEAGGGGPSYSYSEGYYDEDDDGSNVGYPMFEDVWELLIDEKGPFECPDEGSVVYCDWEGAVLSVLSKNSRRGLTLPEIRDFLDGVWIQRSMREFIMLNTLNLECFVNESGMKHSLLFRKDGDKWCLVSPDLFGKNRWFVFNPGLLPIGHLLFSVLDKMLKTAESVPVDVLMKSLEGRKFLLDSGGIGSLKSEMQTRIVYLIQCLGGFCVSGQSVSRAAKDEIEDRRVRILQANDPLCCGLSHKQACVLLGHKEDKGKKQFLAEIVKHPRVFYYNQAIGVRWAFQFKKQAKPQPQNQFMMSVVFHTLCSFDKPVAIDVLMNALIGKNVVAKDKTLVKISDTDRPRVMKILETSPVVVNDNNAYFLVYWACESDIFGGLYMSEAKRLLSKFAGEEIDEHLSDTANKMRVPLDKDIAYFIGEVKNGLQEVTSWLGITRSEHRMSSLKSYRKGQYQVVDTPSLYVPASGKAVAVEAYTPTERELSDSSQSSSGSSGYESEEEYEIVADLLDVYGPIKDGMPLDQAVRQFWPEDPSTRNPLGINLEHIIKTLKNHTFDVCGVSYPVQFSDEGKAIFIYALHQGREFWMDGKQNVICVGPCKIDTRYFFGSLSDLVEWGLEKLHVKQQKGGACFTCDELGKVIDGKPYEHKAMHNLLVPFVYSPFFEEKVVRFIQRPWSTYVVKDNKLGAIRYSPDDFEPFPEARRLRWPELSRKIYESALAMAHTPTPDDAKEFKQKTQRVLRATTTFGDRERMLSSIQKLYKLGERVIQRALDGHTPSNWKIRGHPSPIRPIRTRTPPVQPLDRDSTARSSTRKNLSRATSLDLPLPGMPPPVNETDTSGSSYSESEPEQEPEPERDAPWDPPDLSFAEPPTESICTVKPVKKRFLRAPARIDLSSFESAPAKEPLLSILEERVRSLDRVSIDGLIADLYGEYAGDKPPEDFGRDLLWELGKLQVLREQT